MLEYKFSIIFILILSLNAIKIDDTTNILSNLYDTTTTASLVINTDSIEYLMNQTYILQKNISNFNDEQLGSFTFCKVYWGRCIALSSILGLIILCTIIGNGFVIAAVILERNLHNVANYLIVSLAVADLMVAAMVMPIAAYQEVTNYWMLGNIVCDIWTSFDVLCCTASILHLVAIALDRYWAITKINYGAKRTSKRIITMIAIIWTLSTIYSVLPHIFGLSYDDQSSGTQYCQLTDNLAYQLFSTLGAFYLPLIVMCIIYWKIFQSAKFRIRKKAFNRPNNGPSKTNNKNNNISKYQPPANSVSTTTKTYDEQKSVISSFQNGSINSKLNVNSGDKVNSTSSSFNDIHKQPIIETPVHISNRASNEDIPCKSQPLQPKNETLNNNKNSTTAVSLKPATSNNSDLYIYSTDLTNIYYMNNYYNVPIAIPESDRVSCSTFDVTPERDVENTSLLTKDNIQNSTSLYLLKNANSISEYNFIKRKNDFKSLKIRNKPTCSNNKKTYSMKKIKHAEKLKNLSRIPSISDLASNSIDIPETPTQLKKSDTNISLTQNIPSPSYSGNVSLTFKYPPSSSMKTETNTPVNIAKRRNRIDIKRERKAAKTLGIIMSCFILCWLPFFIMQIMFAICKECSLKFVDSPMVTILTWLGYLNSLLNPIIYTIFSPDFRDAFAKILFGKYRKKHRRYFKK